MQTFSEETPYLLVKKNNNFSITDCRFICTKIQSNVNIIHRNAKYVACLKLHSKKLSRECDKFEEK